MRIFKKILLKVEKQDKTIFFGMPDRKEELKEMFKLRYRVYVKKERYIPKGKYKDKEEIDEYDRSEKCSYFIAKIDNRIIGTARIIRLSPLPIEKEYFRFEVPKEMRGIPRDKLIEIGRLISVKYSEKTYLPRHIVLIGLFAAMMEFGLQNDIRGGFGAIKDKVKRRLEAINTPVHAIENVELIYNPHKSHDPLSNFFNDPRNPVHAVYYLRDELKQYIDSLFNNKFLFKKIDERTFVFRGSCLLKWARFFKIFRKHLW